MKKLLGGNWKSNGSITLIDNFSSYKIKTSKIEIFIAVPYPFIHIAFHKFDFHVAAQNCSEYNDGPFTGLVSARVIKECGAKYVLIGHSESRKLGDKNFTDKILNSLKFGLNIVYCVGENLEDRKNGRHIDVIRSMLSDLESVIDFNNKICTDVKQSSEFGNEKSDKKIKNDILQKNDLISNKFNCKDDKFNLKKENIINIAYEPVWSIGTGIIPNISEIKEVIDFIRTIFDSKIKIRVLYGGSVNSNNCDELMDIDGLDGFLVGASSLTDDFFKIAQKMENKHFH
ncbi:Triosephosphate isomerase [Dictyocoela muelleri]|nr:Triosephosphate isomerase [Dictyocoela muelleri]